MRSSEVQNFNLFAIRNKKLKFFAFGNGLRSNAFRTTQSAHSALDETLLTNGHGMLQGDPSLAYMAVYDGHGETSS